MNKTKFDFPEWPLDLLIDYALKVHHRRIRENGPVILGLLKKVKAGNSVLEEVEQLFEQSFADLETHLMKEENVLFPYLYELFEASQGKHFLEQMHCGTISNPIRVMKDDHQGELERHVRIALLTNYYATPDGASDDHRLLNSMLQQFFDDLREHIHIENELIFPGFEKLEQQWVMNGLAL